MAVPLAVQITLADDYAAATEKVIAALKEEGFGVMTRIDVHDTLKEKLDVDFRRYTILGTCHPPLAHRALQAEPLVGLLLPCNVTVEEAEGGSLVSIVNPNVLIDSLSENTLVCAVASQVRRKLDKVVENLRD